MIIIITTICTIISITTICILTIMTIGYKGLRGSFQELGPALFEDFGSACSRYRSRDGSTGMLEELKLSFR